MKRVAAVVLLVLASLNFTLGINGALSFIYSLTWAIIVALLSVIVVWWVTMIFFGLHVFWKLRPERRQGQKFTEELANKIDEEYENIRRSGVADAFFIGKISALTVPAFRPKRRRVLGRKLSAFLYPLRVFAATRFSAPKPRPSRTRHRPF